jgi:hypothetical protein
MGQAETTQNVARSRGGTVGAQGRRRALQLAAEAEQEREAEAAKLLADLGRPASHSEHVIIEQLTTLIVRGRRLRQAGRGADAEMVARLVIRGMTRLGIRQGTAKPRLSYAERRALEIAAQKTAEGQGVADAARGTETAADSDLRAGGYGAQSAGGAP